ncbi:MAG: hypothetical protein ISQ46_03870 [Methylophilaceae bacterium]|nr:hypothetical protein [Methylophilaceae bacterium]
MNIGYENLDGYLYLIKSGKKTLYRKLKRHQEDNTFNNRYAFVIEHVYLNSEYNESDHRDLILQLLLKDQIYKNNEEKSKFSINLITNEHAHENEKGTSLEILYNEKQIKMKHLKLQNHGHLFTQGEQFSRKIVSGTNSANLMTKEGVQMLDNNMLKADFTHHFKSDSSLDAARDWVFIIILFILLCFAIILLVLDRLKLFKNWNNGSAEGITVSIMLGILIVILSVAIIYLLVTRFCRTIETQFGVRKSECALTNRHFDSTIFGTSGPQ